MTPVVAVLLALQIGNLAYVGVAVVVMIVLTLLIVLKQRKPKSVEANMESFNRGLRALAPHPNPRRAGTGDGGAVGSRARSVRTVSEPDTGPGPEA